VSDDCCSPHPKRNVYLRMRPLPEARQLFLDRFDWPSILESQEVAVPEAVGRVLSEPVYARFSAPGYHASAMDGIALAASNSYGASEATPVELAVGEQTWLVNTGDVLPEGCDAVVMIECVQLLEGDRVRIEAAAYPWQHVRRAGEDIVATEMLFARGHRVTAVDTGALLAGGLMQVSVRRRPRVLVLPTGAEMIAPDAIPAEGLPPGRIVEFNSTVLGKLVEEAGGEWIRGERLPDDLGLISSAIADSLASRRVDAVLVIGGSSAGAKDFTRAAVAGTGEVLVHGVTMMPGKPTVLGAVHDRPVVGIPGYPVSAIVAFEQLVAPALARMLGAPGPGRSTVAACPTKKVASKLGMEEFVRVRLGRVGERLVAAPLPRGAGAITTITEADGFLRVPADLEGVAAGEQVQVELLRPAAEVERTIVAVGSHDMSLDVLADLLRATGAGYRLSSSHVGSLGGLLALRRGACHLAGSHLLDPDDGTYNSKAIARYLPGLAVCRLRLVQREQGLIVLPGNPKGLGGLHDLTRSDVTFVNRQAGSGTRVLLDRELGLRGITCAQVPGYAIEEYTHMAVAVAVQSGAADAGLGIRAAARALGLDFVPVASESYELVIPEQHLEHEGVMELLTVVGSEEFRRRVEQLGGYDASRSGEVVGRDLRSTGDPSNLRA
jgi:putative molybdopterin biosynthesis protein